jgi:hypothetical protein
MRVEACEVNMNIFLKRAGFRGPSERGRTFVEEGQGGCGRSQGPGQEVLQAMRSQSKKEIAMQVRDLKN